MDELNNKMTKEELEKIAGGIKIKNYLRCDKCGFEFSAADWDKYVELTDTNLRYSGGNSRLLVSEMKARFL